MTNVGRAFYCVTRAGDLVMFGRYHDHKVAQLQCPFGCIFADVKLMRHIIHAEVGIPSLEPMIRLKLADACARVAKNTTVRDSFQVAIRILEGKFNAEIDFPTGDEGSVENSPKRS